MYPFADDVDLGGLMAYGSSRVDLWRRADAQGKELRISIERCPDTDRLSHALRMLGAHIDNSRMTLLGIQKIKACLPSGTKGVGEIA
jgi:hypothetical protein